VSLPSPVSSPCLMSSTTTSCYDLVHGGDGR
jgi:hypothetical protein